MLSDAERAYELADIRAAMAETLPERARVLHYVGDDKSDPEGSDEPYTPDAETIAASVSGSSGFTDAEQVVASRFTDRPTYIISIPAHTALSTEDRVRIETRDGDTIDPFRTFDVAFVPDDTGEWLRRIVAVEIK